MYRLITLGGALIEGPEGPRTGAASQRRRLAVLSLLAASRNGISRDRLVALLWPESGDEHARHALAQLLYALRKDLGEEAVVGSATALRLDPKRVSSDIHDFKQALESNSLERAIELYRGPFLDGFHLSGCLEFERWVESERSRAVQAVMRAVETLASRAEQQAAWQEAIDWWRRLASIDPVDPRIALSLIEALASGGDAAGALRHARVYGALVRDQVGTEPDARIGAFIATLATSKEGTQPAPAGPQHVPSGNVEVVRDVSSSAVSTPRKRRLLPVLLGSAAALLTMTLITLAVVRPPMSADIAVADPASRDWVLITDVENATGEPVFQRSFPLALTLGLAQSPRLYVVSPEHIRHALVRMRREAADSALDERLAREIAQRDGIRYVIIPSVQPVGKGFEISARVLDPASAAPVSLATVYVFRPEQVLEAFDQVSRKLRRAMGESAIGVATRSMPLPRVTTTSLEALEKYAAGGRAFNNTQWVEARTLLTEAVTLDSTFAAAHALLGLQAYYSNQPAAGEGHFQRALAHVNALPERERTLIRARIESWRENRAAAVAMRQAFLLQNPDDLEALHELAYDYLRLRRPREARDVYRRVVALDSMSYNTWVNLAVVEKQLGQYDSALVRYRRAFRLLPSMETANSNINHEFGSTYVYVGQLDSAAAVFARMLGEDHNTRARGVRSLAFLAMHRGRYDEAARNLEEAIRLSRKTEAATSEIRNRLLLATSLVHLARTGEVALQLDSAYALARRSDLDPLMGYWLGKALVRSGEVKRPQALLAAMEATRHPSSKTARAAVEALQGEILVARGDPGSALPHLEHALSADSNVNTLESLAHGVLRAGDLARAAVLYQQLTQANLFGHEMQEVQRMANYTLAEIAELRGDSRLAIASYERFLEAWSDPDRALPALTEARERLQRLRQTDSSR